MYSYPIGWLSSCRVETVIKEANSTSSFDIVKQSAIDSNVTFTACKKSFVLQVETLKLRVPGRKECEKK